MHYCTKLAFIINKEKYLNNYDYAQGALYSEHYILSFAELKLIGSDWT